MTRRLAGRRQAAVTAAVVVACSLFLAACGNDDGEGGAAATPSGPDGGEARVPPDLSGVELSVKKGPPTALDLPYDYLLDTLRDWGADIEAIEVIGSLSGSQVLVAGNVQLAQATADELVTNAAAGMTDLVAFGSPRASFGYALVAKNEIGSVEDLEGSVIAMSGAGGFDVLLTQMTLNAAGVDPESPRFVELGASTNRATALLAGRVDAAMIFLEDWVRLQSEEDQVHLLPSIADEQLASIPQVILAQPDFLAENPAVAFAVACANVKMFAWMNEDKEGWIDYVSNVVQGTDEEVLNTLHAEALSRNMFPMDVADMLNTESMQLLADQLFEIGVIDTEVDTATQIKVDKSYLEEAVEAGCADA
jgi:NitT/TauT family transport system substrate-binding protein